MADDNLKRPVQLRDVRVDNTVLPANFSTTYRLYVLEQGMQLQALAAKANSSGKGAFDAQQRNDEQDKTLDDHETRLTNAEDAIKDLDQRVEFIEGDYVSKSATAVQSLASPLDVTGSYSVNGVQVIGSRQTGWTAAIGNAYKGNFDSNISWEIGIINILQIQQIADALTEARQRIKALEDALRTHGLIN